MVQRRILFNDMSKTMTEPTPTPPKLPDSPESGNVFDDLNITPAAGTRPVQTPPLKPNTPWKPPARYVPEGMVSNSLFSRHGRMGRLSMQAAMIGTLGFYLLACLGLILVFVLIGVVVGMSGSMGSMNTLSVVGIALLAIPILVMVGYMMLFYVRRLHDLDKSGWWVLVTVGLTLATVVINHWLPPGAVYLYVGCTVANMLFQVYVLLTPGTKDANRFGLPRYTPTYEKIWGWIYSTFVILMYVFLFWAISVMLKPHDATQGHPTDTVIAAPVTATDDASPFSAPYPFSAQQLWDKLLIITALPTPTISPEQIETALGIKMQQLPSMSIGDNYAAHPGVEWYFPISLSEIKVFGVNKQTLIFEWDNKPSARGSAPPTGMCINIYASEPSLQAQGWRNNPLQLGGELLGQMRLKKDGATLVLFFDGETRCLTRLMLTTAAKH
jgi:uncharacterized membrane protein YhaH (DUF805 family)